MIDHPGKIGHRHSDQGRDDESRGGVIYSRVGA
jgi:hypothetical protein